MTDGGGDGREKGRGLEGEGIDRCCCAWPSDWWIDRPIQRLLPPCPPCLSLQQSDSHTQTRAYYTPARPHAH